MSREDSQLPTIPSKRYFTISEASNLCDVEAHVLRYWEQEFSQLSPIKRRGNRRYYQRHDVMLIRHIKELLYNNGYTIKGAKQKLSDEASDQETKSSSVSAIRSELESIIDLLD
ncbi:MAG: transcriptional regulator [Gammaproteobacteria bacterium]|jgi:DNA-binding transcriptional MerR regulator|nr:transcriptional regulator [Pseudomonadota bacterium]MAP83865.1 transcriptional regulator [Gammaproteobacteria bacterium]MBI73616.1 transcriptional regulator [Gammaproteobacteria bacterium]MEC9063749.1 MerR family transcriptional regulator [Pseudomonadota bacterium]MED5270145.1 MerR family transcriptional regulator [Pseudomonadota bacterium]|tara:strand:- start:62 stop:403 length:342 start_codon:yes stop_codon:yes gene_type:complete